MPKTLFVHHDAVELGIWHPVACLIQNVTVIEESRALDAEIETLQNQLANDAGSILNRPEVEGFRKLFANMGYPKQVPAGERLIESLQRRGFKRFNNVVDAYNIASATFGSGLGMHDASGIKCDLIVWRAEGNEQIVPMFKENSVTVRKGDLVYGDSMCPLAWLGKRDVDSNEHRVTEWTHSLMLVALGNAETSADYNRAACEMAVALIRESCPNIDVEYLGTYCFIEN